MAALEKEEVQRQRTLLNLQKQMQGLRNEMEFVEILVQFWPWSNMVRKMERLEKKLNHLNGQYQQQVALSTG